MHFLGYYLMVSMSAFLAVAGNGGSSSGPDVAPHSKVKPRALRLPPAQLPCDQNTVRVGPILQSGLAQRRLSRQMSAPSLNDGDLRQGLRERHSAFRSVGVIPVRKDTPPPMEPYLESDLSSTIIPLNPPSPGTHARWEEYGKLVETWFTATWIGENDLLKEFEQKGMLRRCSQRFIVNPKFELNAWLKTTQPQTRTLLQQVAHRLWDQRFLKKREFRALQRQLKFLLMSGGLREPREQDFVTLLRRVLERKRGHNSVVEIEGFSYDTV